MEVTIGRAASSSRKPTASLGAELPRIKRFLWMLNFATNIYRVTVSRFQTDPGN